MPDYGIPVAAYRAGLLAEVAQPNLSREHKAAIVAELEALGPRTADEDRAALEAATLGPVTVGRAPDVSVVQDHTDDVVNTDPPVVVSPAQESVASSGRRASDAPLDASPAVVSADDEGGR